MTQLISQQKVRAAKLHTCDDCGDQIRPRTIYLRSAVTDGSSAWTWKEHIMCNLAANYMIGQNWFDVDDWPSWFSFTEMCMDLPEEVYFRIRGEAEAEIVRGLVSGFLAESKGNAPAQKE